MNVCQNENSVDNLIDLSKKNKFLAIDTLCIQGGGIKSIASLGALHVLDQKNILTNIKKYAGSSSGSLLCVLLNIGMNPSQIEETVFAQGDELVEDFFFENTV